MDMIERAMTNRADFSIDASYYSGKLKISWSENPSAEGFAGYEVYIIPERWNEYGTYEVITAPYKISTAPFFFWNSAIETLLKNRLTKSVEIPVSTSSLNGEGEYYVRLGIIKMKKDDDDEYYIVNETNYKSHSTLDKISGYKPVYIK